MKTTETYTLILQKLNCYLPDESDGDEIYLKINDEKIWPVNKKFEIISSGTLTLGIEIKDLTKDEEVIIELWDFDIISKNDLLGNFKITADKPGGPYNTDLHVDLREGNKAKYNLEWKIVT